MKRGMRALPALLAAALLLAGCTPAQAPAAGDTQPPAAAPADGAAAGDTVLFTDSAGREVEVPAVIDRIAITGPMAQIVLFALAPDRLVGVASAWDPGAEQYLDEKYFNLPELGQLYGGSGDMNLESLLASGAQVVIDVGEPKDTIAAELDALQEQTGLPFVHISATTETTGDAYRMLGALLNLPQEAEALASYCESVYARTVEIANAVKKTRLIYCTGEQGLGVIARGSYHAEIIDLLGDNQAVLESPSSRGTGNEVDMEQLLLWDPDVILFAPGGAYAAVGDDPAWQGLSAIREGRYYEAPFGPYNWMGFPPSVQRYLGMMWLAQLLYPDAAQYDLYEEVARYFELFYHAELTREQYDAFMQNSIGKLA